MTLGELKREEGTTTYAWVDYGQDARECLRESLDNALDNEYNTTKTECPTTVVADLCEYAPEFEGVIMGENPQLLEWIAEWQKENS